MDNRAEFILLILTVLLILFVPEMKDSFLELFDFAFINFLSMMIIFYTMNDNFIRGSIFAMLYIFCIMQRRKNIIRIILNKQIDTLNISTCKKVSIILSILKNKKINNEEKEIIIMQIIPMKIPMYKINEILELHIKNGGNIIKVFEKVFDTNDFPHLLFMKKFYNASNKEIILNIMKNSKLNDEIKNEIMKFINEKKVSFENIY